MKKIIRNVTVISEGCTGLFDVLIKGDRIEKVYYNDPTYRYLGYQTIDGTGKILIPGVIDDQVHFREPGNLMHKADIFTESRAAVAGGITSYFEQPNTGVQTITEESWLKKNEIAKEKSFANYGFNFGLTNTNAELTIKMAQKYKKTMPAIKIFMGSSTGDMLVDRQGVLETVFYSSPIPICVHCEDEETVKNNLEYYKDVYKGSYIPPHIHPLIRSAEACWKSSAYAVALAEKFNTRLHVYHITTAEELQLFKNDIPLDKKRITSEACIIHLNFAAGDYQELGHLIKQNPAVKTAKDRDALFQAVLDGTIDVIATDHAPHTWEEKHGNYLTVPSGAPMVQHSLVSMLEFYHQGKISLERVVELMCHNPAIIFNVADRGYIKEGCYADMVLVDLNDPWTVSKENILYKCGWSPFEGRTFKSKVVTTFVNGNIVYNKGDFFKHEAKQIEFDR